MTFRASVERYLGAVAQQYHRGDARAALTVLPPQTGEHNVWLLLELVGAIV